MKARLIGSGLEFVALAFDSLIVCMTPISPMRAG